MQSAGEDDGVVVDARGLKCPLPVMLARRAAAGLKPGQAATVLADDPLAEIDIPHFCSSEGLVLTAQRRRSSWSEFQFERA